MNDAATQQKPHRLGSHLTRLAMAAGALVACWAVASGPAAATTAGTACSLWTHAQISALIDGPKYNTTISTADHCAWQTPGQEVTANELQLETSPVTASNTLVGKSGAALATAIGCNGEVVKPVGGSGIVGYYCVSALAISGAELRAQKGKEQVAVSLVLGLPNFKVKSSALLADVRTALTELHA